MTRAAPAIAALLLAVSIWLSMRDALRWPGIDYYPIWAVVQWVEQGGDTHVRGPAAQLQLGRYAEERSVEQRPGTREALAARIVLDLYGGKLEPYATPFLYAALSAGMTGRYEQDYLVFSLGSGLAYLIALFALARALGASLPAALLWPAALAFPFAPFWTQLIVANVGALQTALLLAALALLVRDSRPAASALAGSLLTLALLLKPTLWPAVLLLAVACARGGELRRAAWLAVGAVPTALLGLALGGAFLGGVHAWSEWLTDLSAMLSSARVQDPFNSSPLIALDARLGVGARTLSATLVGAVALVIAAVGAPARASASAGGRRVALAVAIGCALSSLASPLTWLHYHLAATPLVLLLAADQRERGRPVRIARYAALGAALVLLSTPLSWIGLPMRLVELWFANGAVAALIALGLRDFTAQARPHPG